MRDSTVLINLRFETSWNNNDKRIPKILHPYFHIIVIIITSIWKSNTFAAPNGSWLISKTWKCHLLNVKRKWRPWTRWNVSLCLVSFFSMQFSFEISAWNQINSEKADGFFLSFCNNDFHKERRFFLERALLWKADLIIGFYFKERREEKKSCN